MIDASAVGGKVRHAMYGSYSLTSECGEVINFKERATKEHTATLPACKRCEKVLRQWATQQRRAAQRLIKSSHKENGIVDKWVRGDK